jgi:tetratricopeptide (TPR) repeat protein
LVIGVYWQSTSFDFLNYDDQAYVRDNPRVHEGFSPENLGWAFTTHRMGLWHPLTWLSLMLDGELFGIDPGAFHRTNLLLHAVNAALLYFALLGMTAERQRSAFVAALFAVHALNVQSVAWVAERKNVLSTLFWFAALLAYLWYARKPGWLAYGCVATAFALGLMAKSMLVTLPFTLVLLDYWPLKRITIERLSVRGVLSATRPRLIEKLPLFALSGATSIVAYWAQKQAGAIGDAEITPLSERLTNAVSSYVGYIGKSVWPFGLAFHYPHPHDTLSLGRVAICVLLLIAITVAALVFWRRCPYFLVGWLWFLGTLVPVIGIVQIGSQAMADRYAYIPTIGLFVVVTWGIADALSRFPTATRILPATAGSAIFLLALRAWDEVSNWEDDLALFGHAVDVTDNNYIAHNNFGHALYRSGRRDEGIQHYAEALRIRPNYAGALVNLSNALADQGKTAEAVTGYQKALEMDPNHIGARLNLGMALFQSGKLDEATAHFEHVVRAHPDDATARNSLGAAYAVQNRTGEAAREFEAALRLKPNYESARVNLDRLRR